MGIVSERSVHVLLHWGDGRRLHVRTEIDGVPVLPDEDLLLGKKLASSYRAFLALHGGDLGTLGAAVDGAVILLDELLEILTAQPGDREALEQAAVFPLPVDPAGIAFTLGGAAERLVRTSYKLNYKACVS